MRSHPDNIRIARALAVAVLTGILCVPWAFGFDDPVPVTLKIHGADGKVAPYRAYPENVAKLLFPTGEAIIGPDESPEEPLSDPASMLKKIQVVELSDTDRRFNVTGGIVRNQLFIFDGVFSDNDPATMSLLMRATGAGAQGDKEALAVARLYLALAHYRVSDLDRIVAYKNSDSVQKGEVQRYLIFPDVLGVAHSPEFVEDHGTYTVDFYVYNLPEEQTKGVSHWKIEVGPDGLKERLSAHHDEFRPYYTRGERKPPAGKVIFAPEMMGNGFTDDGATTDLQSWGSTDGPGFSRTHYYYRSHEPAEKRMQDYLHNAVAIIDTRPWLNDQGKSVGTETILIRTNQAKKSLVASAIFEDATSVLEISSISLGNLLRAVDREIPAWRHGPN